jgi:hypothetical protein
VVSVSSCCCVLIASDPALCIVTGDLVTREISSQLLNQLASMAQVCCGCTSHACPVMRSARPFARRAVAGGEQEQHGEPSVFTMASWMTDEGAALVASHWKAKAEAELAAQAAAQAKRTLRCALHRACSRLSPLWRVSCVAISTSSCCAAAAAVAVSCREREGDGARGPCSSAATVEQGPEAHRQDAAEWDRSGSACTCQRHVGVLVLLSP